MIQSTIQLIYDARHGEKKAIIEIVIDSWVTTPEGINYDVKDYAVSDNVREFINSKTVFRSWDQINSINEYLMSQYDYSELSKKESEAIKVQHALLLETQTKPVYGSSSNQWVLTDNIFV